MAPLNSKSCPTMMVEGNDNMHDAIDAAKEHTKSMGIFHLSTTDFLFLRSHHYPNGENLEVTRYLSGGKRREPSDFPPSAHFFKAPLKSLE